MTAIEAKREYKRKWARENKEKVKASQDRYWEKKGIEAKREYKRNWARENKDKVKASQDRYWEKVAAAFNEAEELKAVKL